MTKQFSWHEATRAQLYEIAFNDTGAKLEYKLAALAELQRRNRKLSGKPIERQYAKRQGRVAK